MNRGDDEDTSELRALREFLSQCKPGTISNVNELASLLKKCWGQLEGASQGKMAAYKLTRMEDVEWHPPYLSFRIERHGSAVMGSSRAEMQSWNLNLETQHATFTESRHRQIRPMQPRLDVGPLAYEISMLIVEHEKDRRLKWSGENKVRILIGKILSEQSAVKQTLAGRRRRFRQTLTESLAPYGWIELRPNTYSRGLGYQRRMSGQTNSERGEFGAFVFAGLVRGEPGSSTGRIIHTNRPLGLDHGLAECFVGR